MKKFLSLAIIAPLVLAMCAVPVVMGDAPPVTAPTSATVTVSEFLSVTLSNAPVEFPNADPLETVSANVGKGYPLTATIGAETNVVSIYVKTSADAASFSGPATLDVSNMEWSNTESGTYTSYTTSDATVCTGLGASGTCDIYHNLTIPSGQVAGAYNVDITVTATSV